MDNRLIFHGIPNLIGVVFATIFLIISIKLYKNKEYSKKLNPIKFLYILLIVLEVVKIVANIAHNKSYSPGTYPIIFCSYILYTYPIIVYCKKDCTMVRICKALSVIPAFVIGALYIFIMPKHTAEITTYSFLMNLHSRFFHLCMLAGAVYIIAVKLYDFKFADFFPTGLTTMAYFNFCTILSLLIGGNLSYFGPDSSVMAFVYQTFGYAVGNLLFSFLTMIVSLICFYLINLTIKIVKSKQTTN